MKRKKEEEGMQGKERERKKEKNGSREVQEKFMGVKEVTLLNKNWTTLVIQTGKKTH